MRSAWGSHMKKGISLTLSAAMLAGCTTSPKDIKPAYVPTAQYQDYDCKQIETELASLYARGDRVRSKISSNAAVDAAAVGVGLLFWPALFFLAGGSDDKEEYARIKGEYEALQQAGTDKQCGIAAKPLQDLPAETAATPKPGTANKN